MTTGPAYDNSVRIGYARVSTRTQEHQAQLDALAAAHCREIVVETASTRGDRPKLREALGKLQARGHAGDLQARPGRAGIRGYDLEQCRFHYRQSLLYTLAPGIAMLGQMQLHGGDARGLADTLVLRTLTHAGDLESFATL